MSPPADHPLHMMDGLIGQGLDIGVLITTNELLSGLHPAVMRSGRCGAIVAFELFDRDAGAAWLANAGVRTPASAVVILRARLSPW